MPADLGAVSRTAVMITREHPSGAVVDVERAQLLLTDRAATRGDGVFESMLFRRGRLRGLDDHLARLRASATAMDLALPADERWKAAVRTCLEAALAHVSAPDPPEASVKLVLSRGPEGRDRGPTAWVVVSPVPDRDAGGAARGLKVVTLDRGYPAGMGQRAPWLLIGVKTLSYAVNLAAQRWARGHGADDAVFVSSDGVVLEGATSSVVVARRGADGSVTLVTPDSEDGLLPGTTQAAAFRAAEASGWRVAVERLSVADLLHADGVWLLSSVRLAAAVTEVDGHRVRFDPALHRQLWQGLDREL
jgi:4-amino-4-deoxychorismate lyase